MNSHKILLSIGLLSLSSLSVANELELTRADFFAPSRLGALKLIHNKQGFHVNGRKVNSYDVDNPLRTIKNEKLKKLLACGYYLSVNKRGNEDYAIRLNGRLKGGGPIAGFIGYWGTKALAYGTVAAAATGLVVSTGGVAGGVTGALIAGGTSGATVGTSVVAGAIVGAGGVEAATLTTVGAVTSAGGIGAAVAAVESVSTTVGLALLACPFLP